MNAVPPFGLLIKPVSGQCNLRCGYCFYRHQRDDGAPITPMSDVVLERLVRDYLASVDHAVFAWQGGEPTLAGIGFFEHVLSLQAKHVRLGQTVENALQTNGTLITPEWAKFLADNAFLVGVSVDGRQQDHDRYRRNQAGVGSFGAALKGLGVLLEHRVEVNVLTVVTPEGARNPWKLYTSLRKYGTPYLQFIPLMESPEDSEGNSTTLSPSAYGRFLCDTFDYWYADLQGHEPVSIRVFDNAVGMVAGYPSTLCTHQPFCPVSPVVEADGSVYPCDFFVVPEWLLGNLLEHPLADLVTGPIQREFQRQSAVTPDDCRMCRWLSFCRGGCMAERLFAKNTGQLSYYCEAYKAFFDHSYPRLQVVARSLSRG